MNSREWPATRADAKAALADVPACAPVLDSVCRCLCTCMRLGVYLWGVCVRVGHACLRPCVECVRTCACWGHCHSVAIPRKL